MRGKREKIEHKHRVLEKEDKEQLACKKDVHNARVKVAAILSFTQACASLYASIFRAFVAK